MHVNNVIIIKYRSKLEHMNNRKYEEENEFFSILVNKMECTNV
jgi:hypothetical protein